MTSSAKLKAQYKYDKENTRQVMLKLNKTSDADVLMKLDNIDNRQGYIKELIRNDIRGKGEVMSIDSIQYLIVPVAKRYGLSKVSLFGSYARGEARPDSDIDLIAEGGNYKGLFEYADMIERFEQALGKKIDLVTRTSLNESDRESTRRFAEKIEQDEVLLYESSND